MLIVEKHLQAVTRALTSNDTAPIGELLDKIAQLQAENRRYREALEGLLNSFNRHWIKHSLRDCGNITPTEVAMSVVEAEQALIFNPQSRTKAST